MKKLLKYWNQNKQKILIAVGVIVFIYVCIQVANNFVKQNKEQEIKNKLNSINEEKVQDVTKPSESIITDKKVNEKNTKENSEIIKNFVEYCNNKNIEQAYEILSNNCKEELYNDINLFKQNYVDQIFNTKKTYSLELWAEFSNCYTYKITFIEGNALQTGRLHIKQ